MSNEIRYGFTLGDDVVTLEDVERIPKAPFLDRKYVFDSCFGEILDEATNVRSSFLMRKLTSNAERRRYLLGKWYDSFKEITIHWTRVASQYDEEYKNSSIEDKEELEYEYLCYERANIKTVLDSVDDCILVNILTAEAKEEHPVRLRIKEMKEAWCRKEVRTKPSATLRVINP